VDDIPQRPITGSHIVEQGDWVIDEKLRKQHLGQLLGGKKFPDNPF